MNEWSLRICESALSYGQSVFRPNLCGLQGS